jgi:hypothetical protein
MRYYISGPMSGRKDNNELAFRHVEYQLKLEGHKVVIPHDVAPTKQDL